MEKTYNAYADLINNNRYIAGAQLTVDDLGNDLWEKYRNLTDALAVASWRSLCGKDTKNTIGLSVTALLAFFGIDAKATTTMQKRLMVCCVTVKREQSAILKSTKSALSKAKASVADLTVQRDEHPEDPKYQTALDVAEARVEELTAEIETLTAQPGNLWYQHSPMLDSSRLHASIKCRKLIEDTFADIINERALMTVEELQLEAETLKAERKARQKAAKAAKAEAEKTAAK